VAKLYSLKDFVHDQGLDMGEFKRLNKETQKKWREIHQRKVQEKLAERAEWTSKYYFLAELKHVDPDTFDDLAEWKQEEWRKQYAEWKKDEEYRKCCERKPKRQMDYESAIDVLFDCGIPCGADGSPLGI
jgi:hypothetical protein